MRIEIEGLLICVVIGFGCGSKLICVCYWFMDSSLYFCACKIVCLQVVVNFS